MPVRSCTLLAQTLLSAEQLQQEHHIQGYLLKLPLEGLDAYMTCPMSPSLMSCAAHIEASRTIAEQVQLFKINVSFGNVSSLILLPCYMSHA